MGRRGKKLFFSPFELLHDEGGNTGTDNIYVCLFLSLSLSKEGKACCTDVDFGAVLASLRKDL